MSQSPSSLRPIARSAVDAMVKNGKCGLEKSDGGACQFNIDRLWNFTRHLESQHRLRVESMQRMTFFFLCCALITVVTMS